MVLPVSTRPAALRPRLLRCRWLIAGGTVLQDGGLAVKRGRIERVFATHGALSRAARAAGAPLDLGEGLLAPGFVDAHAHLELGALRGRVPPGACFPDWIRALLRERQAATPSALADGTRAAADELLSGGTTLVADVDSLGLAARALRGHPLRRLPFHELLDARDPARTGVALARVRRALRPRAVLRQGLAPHAPATLGDELLAAAARLARERRLPLMIHWAETPEEELWLEHGLGPLAALLAHSPARRGLELLERAGLVGPRTLLVHGNAASAAERQRLARTRATLVHCPGTHAYFARPRFELERWLAAGVPLALGTDSLASNRVLDMRAELVLLRRGQPALAPRAAFELATSAGARALGLAGRVGELIPGALADFVLFERSLSRAAEAWSALTDELAPVQRVWIGGAERWSRTERRGKAARGLDFAARSTQ